MQEASSLNTSVNETGKRRSPHSRHHVIVHEKSSRPQESMPKGVAALVKAKCGEFVTVSGVVLCVQGEKTEKRAYKLEHAAPGSPIAIASTDETRALVFEKDLLKKDCPQEREIGFVGVLLWDHLIHNGVREELSRR